MRPIIEKQFPTSRIVTTASYAEALQLVVAGEVTAAALNFHAGKVAAAKLCASDILLPETSFCDLDIGMAFADTVSSGLIDNINRQIEQQRVALSSVMLTQQTSAIIAKGA